MLSVNIPVYQNEITPLVDQLVRQVETLHIPFEIRIYDDNSSTEIKKLNRNIEKYSNVIYKELEQNLGRSAIRNKMGFESKFEYLLFIDADSKIISEKYLADYLNSVKSDCVICGGTAYKKEKPTEQAKLLRWIYGTQREAISAEIRNTKKGFIITSNNFLISKSIFEKIHFREDLRNYGHEDTLLGYDLFENRIEIFHMNNPVEHNGLEDSEIFLEKTKLALKNLNFISNNLLSGDKKFIKQVNFLRKYSTLSKYLPPALIALFYNTGKQMIEKNLTGKRPNLFWFDIYKIGYYSTLRNESTKKPFP